MCFLIFCLTVIVSEDDAFPFGFILLNNSTPRVVTIVNDKREGGDAKSKVVGGVALQSHFIDRAARDLLRT